MLLGKQNKMLCCQIVSVGQTGSYRRFAPGNVDILPIKQQHRTRDIQQNQAKCSKYGLRKDVRSRANFMSQNINTVYNVSLYFQQRFGTGLNLKRAEEITEDGSGSEKKKNRIHLDLIRLESQLFFSKYLTIKTLKNKTKQIFRLYY